MDLPNIELSGNALVGFGTSVLEFLSNLWGLGIGLSYRPPRLHRLAELIPRNQFLGSLKVYKFGPGS